MKRAKKPPPQDVIDDAMIFADIIMCGRRAELEAQLGAEGRPTRITDLVKLAMAEYLRRFPKSRKQNDDPFVIMPQLDPETRRSDHENDIQCMFCRKSLNTVANNRVLNYKSPFVRKILDHCELCGLQLLAGMMKPHKPLQYGEAGL